MSHQRIDIELVGGPRCGATVRDFIPGVTPLPHYTDRTHHYVWSASGRRTAYGRPQYHLTAVIPVDHPTAYPERTEP